MTIKLYDTVLLKDGRKASIVERMGDDYVVYIDVVQSFQKGINLC